MTAERLLVLFAFYAAALELGASRGLVGAVVSPVGSLLLVGAGLLFAIRAVLAARAAAPPALRLARVLASGGAALSLVGVPASFVTRDTRQVTVTEGEAVPLRAGLPPVRFGAIALAPHGPHVLSKTITVLARGADGATAELGLFPPTAIGDAVASVYRFGYAVGVRWTSDDGRALADGRVLLGTLPKEEEAAALVSWTPEPNVMMGAGTFPPKLEDLLSPRGTDAHLFLRLDAATISGVRRDLRDPDAYRWLVDGRLEDAVLFAEVFRGKEKVFEGEVKAGEGVRFPGGAVAVDPEVLLWVDLLVTRDPFLPWAGVGLALLAVGLLLRGALAARALARRMAARASGT